MQALRRMSVVATDAIVAPNAWGVAAEPQNASAVPGAGTSTASSRTGKATRSDADTKHGVMFRLTSC